MKQTILGMALGLAIFAMACSKQNQSHSKPQVESNNQQISKNMNSFISIFEIPALDISRAIEFYQAILDIKIDPMEMPGMQMGLFPSEGQSVFGVILKGEGYQPSAEGITLYLNGGDNLQLILDKVVPNGGAVIVPKTPHGDESGYFALFLDSEGNKMGLHSPN